jgi:hypothetical protein
MLGEGGKRLLSWACCVRRDSNENTRTGQYCCDSVVSLVSKNRLIIATFGKNYSYYYYYYYYYYACRQ